MDITETGRKKMHPSLGDKLRGIFCIRHEALQLEERNAIFAALDSAQLCLNGHAPFLGPFNNGFDVSYVPLRVEHGAVDHDGVECALQSQVGILGLKAMIEMD